MTTLSLKELTVLPIFSFADVFPLLSDDEIMELAQDIEAHGLHHPIMLFEDQVLDGRNRIRALSKVRGFDAIPVEYFEGTEYEAVEAVRSLNVLRRHLSVGQRAMAALAYLPYEEAEAKKRQQAGVKVDLPTDPSEGSPKQGEARNIVADKFNLNGPRLNEARNIANNAPDLAEKVVAGTMALDKAYRETKVRQEDVDKKIVAVKEHAEDLYRDYLQNKINLDDAYKKLLSRQREEARTIRETVDSVMRDLQFTHNRVHDGLKEFNKSVPDLNVVRLNEAYQFLDSIQGEVERVMSSVEAAMQKRNSGEWED